MAVGGTGGPPDASEPVETAARIMEGFADRTGLASARAPRRYLWTDAFAVCNYLSLLGRTGLPRFRESAAGLVEQVHRVLGRHRDDDARSGWISGLPEAAGARHPTVGGLRIGKPLNERGAADPYDARLEWDRDGQYYHYLTRWMHALARAGDVLADDAYRLWAVELAESAHAAFVSVPASGGAGRMRWKMSIDLRRALVPSEGAHDPLDGLVTSSALLATLPERLLPRPRLEVQVRELAEMCAGRRWPSDDPLGAGGLLVDACWGLRLLGVERVRSARLETLVPVLWRDSVVSLATLARSYPFEGVPARRLAFRELGLAIGLRALQRIGEAAIPHATAVAEELDRARRFVPLADDIVATWLDAEAQESDAWRAHEDINTVMLATALLPDEYLRL